MPVTPNKPLLTPDQRIYAWFVFLKVYLRTHSLYKDRKFTFLNCAYGPYIKRIAPAPGDSSDDDDSTPVLILVEVPPRPSDNVTGRHDNNDEKEEA